MMEVNQEVSPELLHAKRVKRVREMLNEGHGYSAIEAATGLSLNMIQRVAWAANCTSG